jgi:hypothetical protein
MDLKPENVQTLQEQLILVYKFIKQDRMYKKFFGGDLNPDISFEDNEVLGNIMEIEDSEDIIKNCIIELEEIKTEKIGKEIEFQEVLDQQDLDYLYHKYGLKNLDDIHKLDLGLLFELF